MKSFLVTAEVVFLMTLTPCALAVESVPPVSTGLAPTNVMGARIEFEAPVYDFGKVIAGQTVKHDFIFTNTGDAVLDISGVHASCGCTTAGTWTKLVEPGKTGTIPLMFSSGHFNGAVVKAASVVSNDKGHQVVVLQLKGTVWRPIEVNPPTVVLNLVADSPSNRPATVTITSSLPEPITLSDPISNNGAIVAELKTVQPGKEFHLIVKRLPPLAQGSVQGLVTMKTSSTNVPSVDVNVIAIVQPPWVVTPLEIALPPGPLGNPFPRAVSIRNNAEPLVTLSEPAIDLTNVPVGLREVVPGRQFLLTMTFPVGLQLAPGEIVNLTVKTSDPQCPVIRVPVHQSSLPNPREVGLPAHYRGPRPPPAPAPPASQPVQAP